MNKPSLETRIDIETIYNKGRKYLAADEQRNRNVINLLKYGHKLAEDLQNTPLKNGQVFSRYHKLFKNLRSKMISELKEMGEESADMGQTLKKKLNQLIEEISAKARKYEQSEQRMKQLGKIRVQAEQNEEQEENVKEEMVELIALFKSQAVEMGKDLQKDSSVIEIISSKQDRVSTSLKKETDNVKELNNSNPLGFLTLIGYSAIAVFLWILTMVFIIVF